MRYQNVELHNVSDIITTEGEPGFCISRLPLDVCENVNKDAAANARLGGNAEIRGMLPDEGEARVVLQMIDDNVTPPVVSVYHGCFCDQTVTLDLEPTEIVIRHHPKRELVRRVTAEYNLPFDASLVRVRLPNIHPVRIISIEGDLTYPTVDATPDKTMLSYGSSITHGASAIPPEGSYVAQCARRLGCDLINLGFGGSARLDPAAAKHIAARDDWHFATLEMGINVRDWPRDKFHDAVEHFVGTIAAAHPDKYLFCIDLFTNDQDFESKPTKAVGFRETVQQIAEQFNSDKIIHIDGRTILTDPCGLRTDLVHPSDDGMSEMGANLARVIQSHRG